MNKQTFLLITTLLTLIFVPHLCYATSALLKETAVDPARASLARSRPLTLLYGKTKWRAPASEVTSWFKTRTSGEQTLLQLRPGAIYNYLNTQVSPKINKLGTKSRFKLVDSKLHLVGPGKKGKIVDGVKTSLAIRSAIASGKNTVRVYLKEHRPSIFSASDFNKLRFPDHLARGETNFAGSPRNRVHNIHVATKRFDGLVILPNEQFSFNQYLGTVDDANGYLPELVIKENVTTPEYGGGVCQVSTTAFRAALISGMKITSRRNHSYPVQYYGTPGFDATVYAPSTDLRFINDTGHPIYLTTKILGTRLIFDVWGTNDGRRVTINGPFITARRPDGSLTAAIAQFVTQHGRTIREQNFVSHYQSPDKFPQVHAANQG